MEGEEEREGERERENGDSGAVVSEGARGERKLAVRFGDYISDDDIGDDNISDDYAGGDYISDDHTSDDRSRLQISVGVE